MVLKYGSVKDGNGIARADVLVDSGDLEPGRGERKV